MTPSGVLMPCTMLSAGAGTLYHGGPRVYDHAARRETSGCAPASGTSNLSRRKPARGWLLRPVRIV